MPKDPFSSRSDASRTGPGFLVQVDRSAPHGCRVVHGFHEAAVAAVDPDVAPPRQLVLVGLEDAALAWIAAWAEDSERVRRTITIHRLLDDRAVTAVATLSSYGYGVETALAVESLTEPGADGPACILRSGVHSKEDVDAMLEFVTAPPDGDEASWFAHV